MNPIKVQPISTEEFKNYGTYEHLIDPGGYCFHSQWFSFYRDLVSAPLSSNESLSFSVCVIKKRPLLADTFELHNHTSEVLLALDGNMIMQVAPATVNSVFNPEDVNAFYVPKGTLVILKKGVWHHAPFAVDERVSVLVLLPERTYANDCTELSLSENDKIAIEA